MITFAFFDGDAEATDAMRDDPHWMAGEERRLAGIASLEQEITLTGVSDVVEAVQRERAGSARR